MAWACQQDTSLAARYLPHDNGVTDEADQLHSGL